MENLEHMIAAYFHQDWKLVYATRQEAVADFVARSPDRAASVPREIDELLASIGDDEELINRLTAMGFDDAPPDGDRLFLIDLRDSLRRLGPAE
jgi:hypothetical protein